MKLLIVGAGFAGATYARELADRGHQIQIVDKRNHIGGNAYDECVDGVRVHRYGPHLFHTNNDAIVTWLRRFGEWVDYRHSVKAQLPTGRLTPLPINLDTLEEVFGRAVPDEVAARELLKQVATPIPNPRNAEEHLLATVGRELTDLFFARYTFKMWGMTLAEMDKAVVQRLPLRFNRENYYFPNDQFQMLPRDGYTAIFEEILNHPSIKVTLDTTYEQVMSKDFDHTFNAMPIDEYYGFRYGALPYRSIRFHHHKEAGAHPDIPVVNFTDTGKITRRTSWTALPGHRISGNVEIQTYEEPCSYEHNDLERYYPIKTADNTIENRLNKYKALSEKEEAMTFIGRCGTYQYLDMHQVINQSLMGAERFHRLS